jgi:2,4-dichlorophenol 6-monooxygenase
VSIAAFVVGPGREVLDIYDDWAALSEVSERGCVLVRPDIHVAWRSHDLVRDPTAALTGVLDAILAPESAEDTRQLVAQASVRR